MDITHASTPPRAEQVKENAAKEDLMTQQYALEESMVLAGREAFYREIARAMAGREESGTPYGRRLLKTLLEPVRDAIHAYVEEACGGKAGRRHQAVAYICLVEPEVAAYLTLKAALDGISRQDTLQGCALRVAAALEDEVRLTKFRKKDADKYKTTMRHIKNATSARHRQNVARLMARKAGVELSWKVSDKIHVGVKLLDILREATGLVEFKYLFAGSRDTPIYITATEATQRWISNANERMEILSPAFLPTIVPPKPWSTPFNGGYWSDYVKRFPLVKTYNKNYLEELSNRDLGAVYRAINAMQDTPWKINQKVLNVLKEAWDSPLALTKPKLKLPPLEQIPLPPKPHDIEENTEAKKEWKKRAAIIHAENGALKSKRVQLRKMVEIAERFSVYEKIYFPYQMDFRGRAYAVPMFLNPQGSEHAKALLTFAEGKRLGDGVSAGWLAVHGANVYGYDRGSLEERIAWVEERSDLIVMVSEDPWGYGLDFWTGADKPWQFLAFCFEWAGFLEQGYDYVSSLPVALDGSCNGLQHYSAALRDPVGGAAVNLVPADKPQDIYAKVAEVALEKIRALACPNGSSKGTIQGLTKMRKTWERHSVDEIDMAKKWIVFGADRKLTKRSVMTLPYGSTSFSCREFLEEAAKEKVKEGAENPFSVGGSDGLFKATLWLQPLVWQSIGEVVQAARVGMDWLKKCAVLAADEGLPITWETPDGFLVQQSYYDSTARRVKTHLSGQVVFLNIREELPEIDKRRQAQGIAPNWVHSMDATAMRLFVNLATDNGVRNFALIHDSYGTTAADVEMMSACLKRAFIDLYTDNDPLTDFRVDIAGLLSEEGLALLPPVPPKGALDLSLVEESDYFFA